MKKLLTALTLLMASSMAACDVVVVKVEGPVFGDNSQCKEEK